MYNYTVTNSFNLPAPPPEPPKRDKDVLIWEVCEAMDLAPDWIYSKSKFQHTKQARWIVYKILRSWGYSLQMCGDVFGQDHTTVVNCLKKIDSDIVNIPHLQKVWDKVKKHMI